MFPPAPPSSGTTTGSIRRWSHGRWNLHQFNHPMPIKNDPKLDIQSPNTRQKMIQNRWKSMRVSILFSSGFVTNQRPGEALPHSFSAHAYMFAYVAPFIPDATRKGCADINVSLENYHHPHWISTTTPIGYIPPPSLNIYHHPHWISTTTLIEYPPPPPLNIYHHPH